MRQVRYIEIKPRPRNVFAQAAALLAGVAVLVVSVFLGAFLLAAFLGLTLIVAVTLYVRFWWLRRQFEQAQRDQYIETEYEVLGRDESREREP